MCKSNGCNALYRLVKHVMNWMLLIGSRAVCLSWEPYVNVLALPDVYFRGLFVCQSHKLSFIIKFPMYYSLCIYSQTLCVNIWVCRRPNTRYTWPATIDCCPVYLLTLMRFLSHQFNRLKCYEKESNVTPFNISCSSNT